MDRTDIAELFISPKRAKLIARIDLFCGSAIAEEHWKMAMAELQKTPEEREKTLQRQRKEAAERAEREDAFRVLNRVRFADRTCWSCKHSEKSMTDEEFCYCEHPDLGGDSLCMSCCQVCDAWEEALHP